MTWNSIQRFAKAHVAWVGIAATWYLATYPNGPDVKYVAAAVGLLTALGIIIVPNAPKVKGATKVKGHVVVHRRIPEIVVPGKRLGRHVLHDSRSLDYQVIPDGTVATVRWNREIPVLDQGDVGSCTGNAATGHLGTDPEYASLTAKIVAKQLNLNEAEALTLYSAAEVIDGDGPYPPNDNGSSGLSVAKAAKNAGLISGYTHITSIGGAQTAIQSGPFIIGASWFTSFDTPDANGLVAIAKGATVRGGHEFECIGYNATTDLWELVNSWGTSFGVGGHFFFSTATFKALLADQGDATCFQPLAAPVPVPTPVPVAATVVVDDASLVAKITTLATEGKQSPHDYLAARLHKLWPSAKTGKHAA